MTPDAWKALMEAPDDLKLPDPEDLLRGALVAVAASDNATATALASIATALAISTPVEVEEPEPVDQGRAWATLDHVYRILTSATQDGPRNPAVHAALREIDRLRGP